MENNNAEGEKVNHPLEILDRLVDIMTEQEAVFLKVYTDALNIIDTDDMLKEQQRATFCVRSIKKWNSQLIQLKNEVNLTGIFSSIAAEKSDNEGLVSSISAEMKIGKYVQERMRLLERANLGFSEKEWINLLDKDWCRSKLHIGKAFILLYNPSRTSREQIADDSGNNRYWSHPFSFNGKQVFICSQWYYNNKEYFDTWVNPLAKRVGIIFPERVVIMDSPENKRRVHNNTSVENQKQKIGGYVQKCLRELETMGISFQKDYLDLMLTEKWARENFRIGFPFLKIVDYSQSIHAQIVDENKKNRYWKKPFTFGNVNVFVCNEWHEYTKELFEKWLKDIPAHTVTTQDVINKDAVTEGVVRLNITDYKMTRHHKVYGRS